MEYGAWSMARRYLAVGFKRAKRKGEARTPPRPPLRKTARRNEKIAAAVVRRKHSSQCSSVAYSLPINGIENDGNRNKEVVNTQGGGVTLKG